jgi:transcriptional accessory protein Tex/SPT6
MWLEEEPKGQDTLILQLCCFPHSQFPTPEAVLEGARYMVALQIAREPLVRQVLRQTFQERAKLNITPTKKGRKVRWVKGFDLRCGPAV